MSGNTPGTLPDIRHTVVFQVPLQKVWEAVSTSEGIAAWFMPKDFKPVLGHEFTLQTPFGLSRCKVTELDPPNRLSFTWGEDWVVTFALTELEGKTQFTLIHSGWTAGKVMDETGEDASVVRDRMDQGWGSVVLDRLRKWVEM
ncbi:MAG: SRPBCC domain-containing protein [Brevibacillus sp.]|nr:SRPBCC domain-containing protein [Brevibacillus sp.]